MSQINDEEFSQIEEWIQNKHNEIVLLVKENRNLSSIIHSNGTTLLHVSAKYSNEEMMTLLLEEGLDVNVVNSFRETPLMLAIQFHATLTTWESLLSADADLWEIQNNSGQTALSMLLQNYRHRKRYMTSTMDEIERRCPKVADLVNVLLGAGCELYHLDIFKKAEITEQLIQRGCPVNIIDPEYPHNTALHIAAQMNDLENVKVLLQFEADKNLENSHGCLPVITALNDCQSHSELIILLLPESKNWLEKDSNMYYTFRNCSSEVLEFLIVNYDVDLNAKDSCGRTPLHHLVSNNDVLIWKLLRNLKLNVDACDDDGTSLVNEAVKNNNPRALQYLFDAGANVTVLDDNGRSILPLIPLAYGNCEWIKYAECVEILMESVANGQLMLKDEETIISQLQNCYSYYEVIPIILHFAIKETRGAPLNPIILNHIDTKQDLKTLFIQSRKKLDMMKMKKLFGQTTYFNFLCDDEKKIWRYVQNEDVFKNLLQAEGEDYLHRLFTKRIERAVELGHLHFIVSQFIGKCIPLFMDNHEVLDTILDFLNTKDWKMISKCLK